MKKLIFTSVILFAGVCDIFPQSTYPWTSLNVNGINYTLTTKSTINLGVSPIFYNQHKNKVTKVYVHNDDLNIYLNNDYDLERINTFIYAQNKLKHQSLSLSFLQQDEIDDAAMMGFPFTIQLDALGNTGYKTVYLPTFYMSDPDEIQDWGYQHVVHPLALSSGVYNYNERVDLYKDIIYSLIIPETGAQSPNDPEVFQLYENQYNSFYGDIYSSAMAECLLYHAQHPEINRVIALTGKFLEFYIPLLENKILNQINNGTIPSSMIRHLWWTSSLKLWIQNAGPYLGIIGIVTSGFQAAVKGLIIQSYLSGLAQDRLASLNYLVNSGKYSSSLPGYDEAFVQGLTAVNSEFQNYQNSFWQEVAGDIFSNTNFWIQVSSFAALYGLPAIMHNLVSVVAMKSVLPLQILYWSWQIVANQDDCTQRMSLATNLEKTFLQMASNTNLNSFEELQAQLYLQEWKIYLAYYVYGNYGTRMYENGWLLGTGGLNWINQVLSSEGTYDDFEAVRDIIQTIERDRFAKYMEYHAPMFYLTPAQLLGQTTWMFGLIDVPVQPNSTVSQILLQADDYSVTRYTPVVVSATVKDASGNNIQNEEITFTSNNSGNFSTGTNSSFSNNNGIATITYVPTVSGNHMITAMAQQGVTGQLPTQIVVSQGDTLKRIVKYEYWVDDYATKTTIGVNPGRVYHLNESLPLSDTSEGLHIFNIRFLDNSNLWSQIISQYYYIGHVSYSNNISSYTYWFDENIDSTSTVQIYESGQVHLIKKFSMRNLSRGLHSFHIRFTDQFGLSSMTSSILFFYEPLSITDNRISSYQYWFDDSSLKSNVSVLPNQEYIHIMDLPLTNFTRGIHYFNIRYKDKKGKYSQVVRYPFNFDPLAKDGKTIVAYRYFFDNDFTGEKILQLSIPQSSPNIVSTIAPSGLSTGIHNLNFQFKDTLGQWSSIISSQISITAAPATRTVTNITVLSGQNQCYDATGTLTVGGSGTFIVESGGSVNLIAGQKISFLPGVTVQNGGFLHGFITTDNSYCSSLPPAFAPNTLVADEEIPIFSSKFSHFKVYPNPTTGNFILELTGESPDDKVSVDIYGIWGEKILTKALNGERKHEFSLSDKPVGVYFIRVIYGDKAETVKIIKQ